MCVCHLLGGLVYVVALAICTQWQTIDFLQYLFYVFLKYFHFPLFYMGQKAHSVRDLMVKTSDLRVFDEVFQVI